MKICDLLVFYVINIHVSTNSILLRESISSDISKHEVLFDVMRFILFESMPCGVLFIASKLGSFRERIHIGDVICLTELLQSSKLIQKSRTLIDYTVNTSQTVSRIVIVMSD